MRSRRPHSLSLVYSDHVALDATVIGYSVGIALVTGLMVGAARALRAARSDVRAPSGKATCTASVQSPDDGYFMVPLA